MLDTTKDLMALAFDNIALRIELSNLKEDAEKREKVIAQLRHRVELRERTITRLREIHRKYWAIIKAHNLIEPRGSSKHKAINELADLRADNERLRDQLSAMTAFWNGDSRSEGACNVLGGFYDADSGGWIDAE